MYQIDFHKPLHIHFIGIGGISMSGLAEILLEEDFTVSGSDSKNSPLTSLLESKGAKIYYGQRASNIITMLLMWLSTQLPSIRTTRNSPVRRKKVSRC